MKPWLHLAHGLDWLNDRFGWLAQWAVLASCFISAGNALVRYLLGTSSNGWLEIQWYLFAACVMLGAAQTLRLNEHVRVDVLYGRLSARSKVLLDTAGLLLFLLPVVGFLTWLTGLFFLGKLTGGMAPSDSIATLGLGGFMHKLFTSGEVSSNAGGLIRWPAALMMPLGFAMVWLQGLGEVAKRVAWLRGEYDMETHYERPLQ